MKKPILILLLLATGLLFSCKKERPRPYNRNYHNGDPYSPYYPYPYPNNYPDTNRFVIPITSENVNGYVKFYYKGSGKLISEGNYTNGIPTGYWKIYYPSGKMMREGNYNNGVLSGWWKFFYESGHLKEEGNYSNNIKTGTWHYYHSNGALAADINY